jgi:hypothetical protein
MNCSPPRAIAPSRVAVFPAANARIRNSRRSNMGASIRSSTTQNTTSRITPPITPVSTSGLVQPIEWPPYGISP